MVTNIDSKQQGKETGGLTSVGDRTDHVRSEELKTVIIEVNSHKVKMLGEPATGLEIKEAAIKLGVGIQLNFVLQVELPNGTAKVIGDDDKIQLRDHLSFTAIAPDDNS